MLCHREELQLLTLSIKFLRYLCMHVCICPSPNTVENVFNRQGPAGALGEMGKQGDQGEPVRFRFLKTTCKNRLH